MDYGQSIYKIVSRIPEGKVTTYKIISQATGLRNPRTVGKVLHKNKDPKNIPCHRVVRSNGYLAEGYAFGGKAKQMEILKSEGIEFINSKVKLNKYFWNPGD